MISIPQLIQGIKIVQTKLEGLQTNHDECAFMLGLTGSGKSSILCYLGEAELNWKRKNGKYLLSHSHSDYPEIGNTNQSCTQVPSLYKFKEDPNFYYDPPGFLDTKGVQQEILNSYCNSKMFKLGTKAKIVIVVEISTLKSARGGSFVDVAKRLRELFNNDFRQIVSCCLLVVSKLNQDEQSIEDVEWEIKQILKDNKQLETQGVMLLSALINQKRIISFPLPRQINLQKINQIRKEISKLSTFSIASQPNIAISPEAKNCLQQIAHHCEKQKCDLAHQIGKDISYTFEKGQHDKQSLKKALSDLKFAVEMLANKEIESGIPQKVREFQQRLKIKDIYIEGLKEWMSQVQFCTTIYQQMKVSTKISQILLMYITQTEKNLQGMLNQIATKDQIAYMNQSYKTQMERREKQFSTQLAEQAQQIRRMEQRLQNQANNENKQFMEMMMQSQRQHMKEMNAMNSKLIEILSRPKPRPKRGGGGVCEIM